MTGVLRVYAPATVANVAAGFDIFGLALDAPGDEVTAKISDKPGIILTMVGEEARNLPIDPTRNAVTIGAIKLLSHLKESRGVEMTLKKNMPFGSGLGSSAASAAGGVFAVNELFGAPLSRKELIAFAMESERLVSGSAHADNVAPALLGGFVLIRSYEPLDVVQIPVQMPLYVAIFHPHLHVSTKKARTLLKETAPLSSLVRQTGNAAGVIAALLTSDSELLARALEDVVIEPQRASLVPEFYAIKKAALNAGAYGCSFSGSGPSIFALARSKEIAEQIAEVMKQASPTPGDIFISEINRQGTRRL